MHWSDMFAQRALDRVRPDEPVVIGSGISLSGPVHVGHSREFLTAALIANAVRRQGGGVRFIAFADDMDPLRKTYPFLPPDYSRWVGCPLYRIPDPYECHSSYADHFLQELLDAFEALHIAPEVIRSSEMYNFGAFAGLVTTTLTDRDRVNAIIDRVTGRESRNEWPFLPECPRCSSVQSTRILGMTAGQLQIYCEVCNEDLEVNLLKGGGKLTWRCDWPMRWAHLGVTIEPFGHDHNVAGGSYESGQLLAEEIYGIKAPIPVPYSWIHFKSGGAMHSSSGKATPIVQLAQAYPPEIIWWMIARREPAAVIPFDPEVTLLDEARLLQEALQGKGTHTESVKVVEDAVSIRQALAAYPLDHLILVAQLAQFKPGLTLQILRRSRAYKDANVPVTQDDLEYIRSWVDLYGEHYRVRIRQDQEPTVGTREELRGVLSTFRSQLLTIGWEAETIHNTIHQAAKSSGIKVGDLFAELYRYVIGQDRGPRIGWLFETLGRDRVIQLLT